MKRLFICLLAAMLLATSALAEPLTLEGTVVAVRSTAVLSTAAGVIRDVSVQAGDHVTAGQAVAALMEKTIYAEASGTVKIFGEPGESVETVTTRNGAVMYLMPDSKFTISASTRNAYDQPENKIIHPGETVYVRCNANSEHTGIGMVISLNGSSYTVEITQGDFEDGETVYLYRDPAYATTSRIGKGTIAYADPVAYTATGMVARLMVNDGDHVEKGTALFSTIETTAYNGNQQSPVNGTVASVEVMPGTAVEEGALLAVIYPDDALRLQILADEVDLRSIAPGQQVTMTFTNGVVAQGQVEYISGIPYAAEEVTEEAEDDTSLFPVLVSFATDSPIAYGMTAQAHISE